MTIVVVVAFVIWVVVIVIVIAVVMMMIVIVVAMIVVGFFFWVDEGVDAKDEDADAAEENEEVEVWGEVSFDAEGGVEVEEEAGPRDRKEAEEASVE